MTVRAEFQKSYLLRYAVLACVCLGMAAWFAYDGLIGYPRQAEYALEWEKLDALEGEQRIDRWRAIAAEKGWPSDVPEDSYEEMQSKIVGQYIWAGLNLLIGIPALVMLLRARGRWVESVPGGLKTSWGQTLQFSEVQKLDKRKWSDKGIARATYQRDGRTRIFVFDDFKFEREPLGTILRELEAVLKPEQIVGGPPESAQEIVEAPGAEETDVQPDAPGDQVATRNEVRSN